MSLPGRTFVVDGSNAVHALFGPLNGHAEAAGHEREFLRLLADWAGRRPDVEAEAVFDGAWRPISDAGSRVRVLFAEGGPADAIILERVRALRYQRRKVTVVTQDRELADAARSEESRVLFPERFWDLLSES